MTSRLDGITLLLIAALVATLVAFFSGVFPYPYGWIVLTALLLMRLTTTRQKD